MPITDLLERNAKIYANDVALVEVNPAVTEVKRVTWREYELMETNPAAAYRREITWNVFNEKANRFAHLLMERGIKKDDKVGILLMNCLEWLPIYFGILKTGAIAVPLNFRYSSDEIEYCVDLADVDILVFGPEFIGRVEEIAPKISKNRLLFYVGEGCPSFAEDYNSLVANCSSMNPDIPIIDDDNAAIYFSSGTTGKTTSAICSTHQVQQDSLRQSYINIRPCLTLQSVNRIIINRLRTMYSFASHRFIIQVLRCTGSEAFSLALRQFS